MSLYHAQIVLWCVLQYEAPPVGELRCRTGGNRTIHTLSRDLGSRAVCRALVHLDVHKRFPAGSRGGNMWHRALWAGWRRGLLLTVWYCRMLLSAHQDAGTGCLCSLVAGGLWESYRWVATTSGVVPSASRGLGRRLVIRGVSLWPNPVAPPMVMILGATLPRGCYLCGAHGRAAGGEMQRSARAVGCTGSK